jgi:hypothetical protein
VPLFGSKFKVHLNFSVLKTRINLLINYSHFSHYYFSGYTTFSLHSNVVRVDISWEDIIIYLHLHTGVCIMIILTNSQVTPSKDISWEVSIICLHLHTLLHHYHCVHHDNDNCSSPYWFDFSYYVFERNVRIRRKVISYILTFGLR